MLQKLIDLLTDANLKVAAESDEPSVRADFIGLDDQFLPIYEVLVRAEINSDIDIRAQQVWNVLRDARVGGLELEVEQDVVPVGSTRTMDIATITITGTSQWRTR